MDLCNGDEQLKRTYSCKICFELFSKNLRPPVSLTCGHTFCGRCVKQLSTNDHTSILCGICRRGTYADFRQLGKNVTLLDLLEQCNLLADEDTNETADDVEEPPSQPWQGARHFVTNSALTTLFDRHTDLRSCVRQFLSPIQWNEFDEPLDSIRCSLSTIEGQLREAGDSFVLQKEQLEQLEVKFQGAMAEFYHRQTSFDIAPSRFVPVRWAVSDYSDDDINLYAISPAQSSTWEVGTSNNNSRPPNNGGSDRQRQRRSKRKRRPRTAANSTAFDFVFGVENGVGSNFDSWGVVGADEWDQSGPRQHQQQEDRSELREIPEEIGLEKLVESNESIKGQQEEMRSSDLTDLSELREVPEESEDSDDDDNDSFRSIENVSEDAE